MSHDYLNGAEPTRLGEISTYVMIACWAGVLAVLLMLMFG